MNQLKISYYGLTDIGNVRQVNEDSLGSVEGPYGPVFTVCDGMGGHVGGATASKLAVKSILEFITGSTVENPSVTINNALISANQKVFEAAVANPELKGMGTTATILVVQPQGIYIGHIGDSRIYIFSDGRLHRLTKDDSFVQTLVDSGAITDDEAESHPRKNELLKAIGVTDNVQPTIAGTAIKPKLNDIFLLCTDGLCGLVHDKEIQDILAGSTDLKQAAEQLITVAKKAGGFDNITVQLVKITESPYTVSEFNSYSPKIPAINTPVTNQKSAGKLPEYTHKAKRLNIPKLLAVPLFIIVAYIVIAYFAKTWPFKSQKSITSDSSNIVQPGKDGFLEGDKLSGGFLVHTLTEKEKKEGSLATIVDQRKAVGKLPYRDFDFDSTYSVVSSQLVDESNFRDLDFPILKWKKRVTRDNNGSPEKIVVSADSINAANARKNQNAAGADHDKKPGTHDQDQAADAVRLQTLMDSLDKSKANLSVAAQKVVDAELHQKKVTDSLKGKTGKKVTEELKKVRDEVNASKKVRHEWDQKCKALTTEIEALKKKLNAAAPPTNTTLLNIRSGDMKKIPDREMVS